MTKLSVKYIDTTEYTVTITPDPDPGNSPATWGNFKLVTFNQRLTTDGDIDDYFTEAGKVKPGLAAQLRAGVAWRFDIYGHSGTSYKLHGEVYLVNIETVDGRQVDGIGGVYGYDGVKTFINETIPGAVYTEVYE
jgi:hypothetical protein